MELIKYEGKKVRIISQTGKMYEGYVGDYCYPEDDDNGKEMIVVDVERGAQKGKAVGFYEDNIQSIEIITE